MLSWRRVEIVRLFRGFCFVIFFVRNMFFLDFYVLRFIIILGFKLSVSWVFFVLCLFFIYFLCYDFI